HRQRRVYGAGAGADGDHAGGVARRFCDWTICESGIAGGSRGSSNRHSCVVSGSEISDLHCQRHHRRVRLLDAPGEHWTASARGRAPLREEGNRLTMQCAVIGAGAWGTALADVLARNNHAVRLWAYESDVVDSINRKHENARFLKGHALTPAIEATGDLDAATESAELIVFATPSHVLRIIAKAAARTIPDSAPLVVATKGIEKDTLCLMTEVVEQELDGATVIALSGPSFASEVVSGQPTAVVVASAEEEAASVAQLAFSSPYFRAYTHTDVVGVELGGALKNVMAVATGIAE